MASKAPAFQFYPGDWLRDTELQSACSSSRGIWMNALCRMFFAKTRGRICGTQQDLCRLLNCTSDEFDAFLRDAKSYDFCSVTFRNKIVTLTNRRMYDEELARQNTKERVKRHRNAKCNADVTPLSPSPTPSPNNHDDISVTKSVTNIVNWYRQKTGIVHPLSQKTGAEDRGMLAILIDEHGAEKLMAEGEKLLADKLARDGKYPSSLRYLIRCWQNEPLLPTAKPPAPETEAAECDQLTTRVAKDNRCPFEEGKREYSYCKLCVRFAHKRDVNVS